MRAVRLRVAFKTLVLRVLDEFIYFDEGRFDEGGV
jgi:hypothetical protein